MTKRVVRYARVSQEEQNREDSVSIDQQLADIQSLCARNGWQIAGTFVDCRNYRGTQNPGKGKVVNPSGERADRPEFVKMLALVQTGDVDAVLCWRDDRLVRHPRVAVALEDSLDIGDTQRVGKGKIEVYDATGAQIDRFTLSIKAAIWREENKRRSERTKMGKIGTLRDGRWPGPYNRYGYKTVKDNGKRGHRIVLGDASEIEVVKSVFQWCDAGLSVQKIRQQIRENTMMQRNGNSRWCPGFVLGMLHSEDYAGRAVWRFSDDTEYAIRIPAIVDHAVWERCQRRLEQNLKRATRRAKGVYLLQGLVRCGGCGSPMGVHQARSGMRTLADGTHKRYECRIANHQYWCFRTKAYPEEPHPQKSEWGGVTVDYAVWRYLVDQCIMRPDLIQEQILRRQAELQKQGDDVDGDIAQAMQKLEQIDEQRAFYQRQAARSKITEAEFDARMDETEGVRKHWQGEIERLKVLRDDRQKVKLGLDYAAEFLTSLQKNLADIDQAPRDLVKLPVDKRLQILTERRKIVLALCEEVRIYDDRIEIDGLLDGGEVSQFGLETRCS